MRTHRVDLERQHKEKTMGRPIQKRKIGLGSAKIEVSTAYFTGDGSATASRTDNQFYIDRQRGSLQFLVKDRLGTKSEKLKLVGKATPGEGEFNISVTLDASDPRDGVLNDSATYYVTKLHNKTVSCQADNDPDTMIHLPYQLTTEGQDEGLLGVDFTIANIDVQK